MKRTLFFTLILCALTSVSRADIIEIVNGLIFFDRQIQQASFEIPTDRDTGIINIQALQGKVKYYDEWGNKRTLKPKHAKEYRFTYRGETIRMISTKNSDFNKQGLALVLRNSLFLRCTMDGPVRLLEFRKGPLMMLSPGPNPRAIPATTAFESNPAVVYVLIKDGKSLVVNDLFTESSIKRFLPDCPKLLDKLKKERIRAVDAPLIVKFYNENCATEITQ
ncbi:hypothetical protein FUAX_49680 (plasmid) [Fulvitalea axinellae]|uniref:GLPGLI family protein n=1 Tax=Fulvitalea axinellae TaxID=1182444 RepID=A0AAU9DHF4_9BACT|nr:hypothetical protein FUAX_49680 [Fulvitalea axinellae]